MRWLVLVRHLRIHATGSRTDTSVGGLGQVATQIGKAKGCKVVAIDINDETLEVCKRQGADAVFNSKNDKNFAEELKKITNGGAKAACVFSNAQAVCNFHCER